MDWLKGATSVAVTAGASTPTPITKEVIKYLEQFDPADETTWTREKAVPLSKILPKVRTKKSS